MQVQAPPTKCNDCGSTKLRFGYGKITCDDCGLLVANPVKYKPEYKAKPVKKRKISRSELKRKCDKLASTYYRNQTPYCELAGKDGIKCSDQIQWMHIITRANLRLRYERFNHLIGCRGHHWYYTNNPVDWVRFLEKHFPERLAECELHRNEIDKPDYEALIDKFK
jgi:uncharacterized Zn finger protein (UPF0148 family)